MPELADVAYVRPVDPDKFNPNRFSSCQLGDRETGISSLSLGVFRMPPRMTGTSLHAHKFDQIYYVISGTMNLRVGFDEFKAGPDSLVVLPKGMPHGNWNESAEPEYHLNLRIPEATDGSRVIPVTYTL